MKTILLATFPALSLGLLRSSASTSLEVDKNRPVSKVILLLKDMAKQLEKEADEDEAMYNKMVCWCEQNDKDKTKTIADAQSRVGMLQSEIERMTAAKARLTAEVEGTKGEVASNQETLAKMTALREKQLAEFHEEEKDLIQSVSALEAAIEVLSKHHPQNSLLQASRLSILNVADAIQSALEKHKNMLAGVLTRADRRKLDAFVQRSQDMFSSTGTVRESYDPQSSEIFGILQEMLRTFKMNLSSAQKEELANSKSYKEMKAAKEDEIKAGTDQFETKSAQAARTGMELVQAKSDIEDTQASLSADEQFLLNLKSKCQMTDKEWEERTKTRQDEMQAVSKALQILSDDDAHDTFTKTFNPSLIQLSIRVHSQRQQDVATEIAALANKTHNPKLIALASHAKIDAFEKVKEMIDQLVEELKKERADDVKIKDNCIDGLHSVEKQTANRFRDKAEHEGQIANLEMTIDGLKQAVDGLKAEIKEMQVQLKRAGEDRSRQNQEFQAVVADQRNTQILLKKAIMVLEDFYKSQQTQVSFVHKNSQEPSGSGEPSGFNSYKKSSAGGGVVALLTQILNDAKAMEADAVRDEKNAQTSYEDFVKESNRVIESKQQDILNKQEATATAKGEHIETKKAHESTLTELEQLANEGGDLHKTCDFLLKNFDLRVQAREEEIDGLQQAKALLSGATLNPEG